MSRTQFQIANPIATSTSTINAIVIHCLLMAGNGRRFTRAAGY